MRFTLLLLVLALSSSVGCSDAPEKEEEEIIPGDEFPLIERSEPGPGAGTDGPDPAAPLTEGARVGRFRGGAPLITGPEARCREGDFILMNEHLTACISDGEPTDQMQFTAGRIIDLVPTDDPTSDTLDFIGPGLGLLEASTDELAILSDGTDGGPAVLQSVGVDLPLKIIVGSLGNSMLTPNIRVRVETEFRLAPGAKAIEVVTWASLDGARAPDLSLGDLAFPGDLNALYTWPHGFGPPGPSVSLDAAAFIGRDRSYGILADTLVTPSLDPSLLSDSIFALVSIQGKLGSEFEAATRRLITVGDGTTTSLRANLGGRLDDDASRHTVDVEGTFVEGFALGKWAIFHQDGRAIDVVRVAPETTSLRLPAGELRAQLLDAPWGANHSFEFSVPSDAPVVFPAPDAIPVRVSCAPDAAPDPAPACRVDYAGSVSGTSFQRETEPLLLPRGFSGTLRMSLGETFEYAEEVIDDLQVAEEFSVALPRTLDTTGFAAGDLHQHAMRSADSSVPSADRVLANLAAGLDFLAPSDHDVVEDYPAVLAYMGIPDAIHVFQGVEISPLRGHINVFPVVYGPSHAGGAPALAVREDLRTARQRSTRELLSEMRTRGAQVAQLNHARDETSSLLDWVDYDPVSGAARERLEDMPEHFEAMEVFNNSSAVCTLMRDWFSFHRHGRRVVAFGNSDTHALSSPSGWPRNYIHVGDEPVSDATLVDGILAGRVFVSGGLLVDYGDGVLPGDTIEVSGDATSVQIPLRVRSPSWAKADELIVYVNGVEQSRVALRDDTELEDLLDFEGDLEVTVSGDSFVVVFAYSDTSMNVVTPGKRPFGFANPIYIDVGGDGFTAPGVSGVEDVPRPTGIPFCPDDSAARRATRAEALDPWTAILRH